MRHNNIGILFMAAGLFCLVVSLFFGLLGATVYIWPEGMGKALAFTQVRPLHVSLAVFWILFTAIGAVYSGMKSKQSFTPAQVKTALMQFLLMASSVAAIVVAYLNKQFGGREYLEFPPQYAIFIATGFILFLFNYISWVRKIKKWPVYLWMWLTGIIFFIITFAESYLWLIPGMAANVVKDLAIQWKAGGSIVGSWNMLVYGAGLFIMEKVSGKEEYSRSKIAFFLYFLGLTNLMFNWGHHIYLLPVENYIRYISYAISMTEWIILVRIIYLWKKSVAETQVHFSSLSVRFLYTADVWVLLNLFLALAMSVPGIALYTHGTHVTVAHAMGATIGINSMLLLAAVAEYFRGVCALPAYREKIIIPALSATRVSLLFFWLALIGAGVHKAVWLHSVNQAPFSVMMKQLAPWFWVFGAAGFVLAVSLCTIAITFAVAYAACLKNIYMRSGGISFYRKKAA